VTTPSIAREVDRRARVLRPKTLAASLGEKLLADAYARGASGTPLKWPSPRYANDVEAFAREVLGIRLWSKQVEICEAVRDHLSVSVASGNKCGKTEVCAVIALWYYCTFPTARVLVTAVKKEQIQNVLWKAIAKLHRQSGICADCADENIKRDARREPRIERPCAHSLPVDGICRQLAASGIKADDGRREVVGFTSRTLEGVSGISGSRMLYICDEASGIKQDVFDAIEGNRMGGNVGKLLISNPTRTEGEFFDSHHSKKDRGSGGYTTITISGEETPNFRERRDVIPGLASFDAIMDRRRDWGPDYTKHPLYLVRVLGQFVQNEAGKIITLESINASEADWFNDHDNDEESPKKGQWLEPPSGRLRIGIDPAGPGSGGDETAFVAVRGRRVIRVLVFRGISEEAHLVHLRALLEEERERGEVPLVAIDREGSVGVRVWGLIRSWAEDHEEEMVVVGVRSSDRAQRQPQIYDRLRDELWAAVATWVREGGMLPPDTKLSGELHSPSWASKEDGRLKATPKDLIRKNIGRSTDRADALALATWLREDTQEDERLAGPPAKVDVYEQVDEPVGNPWDALSFGRGRD
jgi:hypothetical protein